MTSPDLLAEDIKDLENEINNLAMAGLDCECAEKSRQLTYYTELQQWRTNPSLMMAKQNGEPNSQFVMVPGRKCPVCRVCGHANTIHHKRENGDIYCNCLDCMCVCAGAKK